MEAKHLAGRPKTLNHRSDCAYAPPLREDHDSDLIRYVKLVPPASIPAFGLLRSFRVNESSWLRLVTW